MQKDIQKTIQDVAVVAEAVTFVKYTNDQNNEHTEGNSSLTIWINGIRTGLMQTYDYAVILSYA